MSDECGVSPITETIREVPGIALASIGFGCAFLAIEGDRLSAIRTVNLSGEFHSFASLVSLCILVLLVLAYRRRKDSGRTPTTLVISTGVAMSVSMFVTLQQGIWEETSFVSFAGHMLFSVFEGLLLFLWVKTLFPYGARATATILAFATIVAASLNCLIAFLKVDAAYATVATLPIISVVLLSYFREYAQSHALKHPLPDLVSDTPDAGHAVPDLTLIVPSDRTTRGKRVFAITLALSLFCYAVIFGHIHYQWLGLQDGSTVSLIIQIGTAVGTAFGGLAILALVQCFWSRRNLELYKVFLIPTVLLALWLSSFVDETWIFLYLLLLNVTQKLVFFFIMLAPFLIEGKQPHLFPWCVALLSFTAGKVASSLLLENMSTDIFVFSSVIALIILFVCGAATSFFGSITDSQALQQTESCRTNPCGTGEGEGSALHTNKLQKACRTVAEGSQLTNREEEILFLLARGRTAQHIAGTLVITQSTAKTHLRNIYAKLNVHNQQEIIDLVEKTIATQRKPDSRRIQD